MPFIDPSELQIDKPELIFGLTAAVGTPLSYVINVLNNELSCRGYSCDKIQLSGLMEGIELRTKSPSSGMSEYDRISCLMNRGNELRQLAGANEALALFAVAKINGQRPKEPPFYMSGRAFVLRQLKHPDEVFWLRTIYGQAFHLLGVYCPEKVRRSNLEIHHGMSSDQADSLIKRDMDEKEPYGQHLRDTFCLADVFIEMNGTAPDEKLHIDEQVRRYLRLLFGEGIIAPTVDEYGMHLAYSASLRSADLSRQVGAAILTQARELVSLGNNEVPSYGGGQYWEDGENECRDVKKGYDSNTKVKHDILREMLEVLQDDFLEMSPEQKTTLVDQVAKRLESTRLMNLTEFGRAVHAEMEAVLAAGRLGVSIRGCNLYVTTFPCHNCAKHIVGAGLQRVVYIEPYPKSMARDLHDDAIVFAEDKPCENKICFEPFVGVAPRKYWTVFSICTPEGKRLKRKTSDGKVNNQPLGLRTSESPLTYIDREQASANVVMRIGEHKTEGEQ